MANEQHLDILNQGVPIWNEWRETHPDIVPDLRNAELACMFLDGANFSGADMRKACLFKAFLEGADFRNADLRHAYMAQAFMEGADFDGADVRGVWDEDATKDENAYEHAKQ